VATPDGRGKEVIAIDKDEAQFALLRPHVVGRKTAISAAVLGTALAFPAIAGAAYAPRPVNQTGVRTQVRMHPVNQLGHKLIRMLPVNQTRNST